MKYTLVPPNDPPVKYTASCPEIGWLLMNSPDGDLTINQRQLNLTPEPPGIGIETRLLELRKQ
jgi:hypothetical protein